MANKAKQKFTTDQTALSSELSGQNRLYQGIAQNSVGNAQTGAGEYADYARQMIDPAMYQRMMGMHEGAIADYAGRLTNMWNTAGYNPQERQGMTVAATAPVAGAFDAAGTQMANHAAMTGNAGAADANIAEMARQKARGLSTVRGGLQGQFADARRQDQNNVIQNYSPLFSQTLGNAQMQQQNLQQFQFPSSLNAQMYGQSLGAQTSANTSRIGTQGQLNQQAMEPGFWSKLALAAIPQAVGGGMSMLKGPA